MGRYYPDDERYVLYAGTQGPHAVRPHLPTCVPLEKVQVISEDMGGGFGEAGAIPNTRWSLKLRRNSAANL